MAVERRLTLFIEDNPDSTATVVDALSILDIDYVHVARVDSIQNQTLYGFDFDELPVLVELDRVKVAFVDFELPPKLSGESIVPLLKMARVPDIVGISSVESCNRRMIERGANRAALKPAFIRELQVRAGLAD